jgi:hypothetical protein
MLIHAHKNLHKGTFSVVDPKAGKNGRVIEDANTVFMHDVEFRVRKAGLARVREENSRNVHAYIAGERVATMPASTKAMAWHRFRYNPFLFSTFVLSDNAAPVHRALYVAMDTKRGTWLVLHPEDEKLAAKRNPARALKPVPRNEFALWNG